MTALDLRLCFGMFCPIALLACHTSHPVATPPEAQGAKALAPQVFRALGQEPGWQLTITPGQGMHLQADYGEREVYTPYPEPTITAGKKTYHAITEAHDLLVVIESGGCQDVMSGEDYPYRVTLSLDGERYTGCGSD